MDQKYNEAMPELEKSCFSEVDVHRAQLMISFTRVSCFLAQLVEVGGKTAFAISMDLVLKWLTFSDHLDSCVTIVDAVMPSAALINTGWAHTAELFQEMVRKLRNLGPVLHQCWSRGASTLLATFNDVLPDRSLIDNKALLSSEIHAKTLKPAADKITSTGVLLRSTTIVVPLKKYLDSAMKAPVALKLVHKELVHARRNAKVAISVEWALCAIKAFKPEGGRTMIDFAMMVTAKCASKGVSANEHTMPSWLQKVLRSFEVEGQKLEAAAPPVPVPVADGVLADQEFEKVDAEGEDDDDDDDDDGFGAAQAAVAKKAGKAGGHPAGKAAAGASAKRMRRKSKKA